jgi:hypothetical protein
MADTDPTEVELATAPPARSGRRVAVAIGAAAVVVAGVFAAVSLGSDSNGPEDPVRAMFAAAEKGDVLGVMEQLDPGERDALQDPITDLVEELNRLDVLHDADLGDVAGVDLEVDDLELSSDVVRDDVARVHVDGGRATTSVDPKDLPLGGFVQDIAGDPLDSSQTDSGTSDLSTGDDFVATVKRGDRWYVSIGYTIAEQARRADHVSFADMGPGIAPKGADSPEDAVHQLIEAGTKLDARAAVALLSPEELGALQDYAGLWLDGIDASEPDAEVTVSNLDLDSEIDGDRGKVFVRDAEVSASGGNTTFSYEDGCLDVTTPDGFDPETGEEGPQAQHLCNGADPTTMFQGLGFFGGDVQPPKLSFEGKHAELGIGVQRIDGRWYVSPVRTALDSLVAEAKLFQRSDLTKIKEYVEDVFQSFTSFGPSMDGGTWCNYAGDPSAVPETVPDGLGLDSCTAVPTTIRPAD